VFHFSKLKINKLDISNLDLFFSNVCIIVIIYVSNVCIIVIIYV